MTTILEWLAQYDALDAESKEVTALFDAANEGEGRYEEADSARFDLWEQYADLAHSAAELLRELHRNSTLPSERGDKAWYHLDGGLCTEDETKIRMFDGRRKTGICNAHDRRVSLKL